MDDLDIDGSLPGQELEEEEVSEEIRRENELISRNSSGSETWINNSEDEDSQRGMLYLIAGVGYGALVVYLVLVIYQKMDIPILSPNTDISNTSGALSTSLLISAMVFITIATSWDSYQTVMTVSALLTSISTWAYLRSSQMKI